jgi:hypothetical protein
MTPQEVCTMSVAAAADEWFSLRARAEQLVAEANAALAARTPPLDLVDEAGTGELAFVVRHGAGSVRVAMGRRRGRGWVEVVADPGDDPALEDLINDMLTPERNGNGPVNG